ncbi:hypothetical protein SAMN05880501_10564 [Ureibacillus xyleni]|uniref:Uncharacterized protein n=1 Tax=Ureibacillus xyleni TaxID=614648 RepID=A0A285SLT4_9BACL|nr:hypothetical protein [Ureibacillus xyleni]SOC08346.1 hypothetical protein SAMN05880501_10564 [Ureibacillus xyleni]
MDLEKFYNLYNYKFPHEVEGQLLLKTYQTNETMEYYLKEMVLHYFHI